MSYDDRNELGQFVKADLSERFWAKVDVRGPDDCWPWTGCVDKDGYGFFAVDGRNKRAHRICWFLTHGEPPKDQVLHSCDNPPCCNPKHHFSGSNNDNVMDMISKGRAPEMSYSGSTTFVQKLRRGESHPVAKLTDDDVYKIRELYASGVLQKVIGLQFGIEQTNVSLIVRRKTWRHVP